MTARLVDLSHPVGTGMPVYPGDPEVRIEPAASLTTDGFAVAALHLGSHSGTHVDAPAHLVDGGTTIDRMPLSRFVGDARVVRARGCDARARIALADLDLGDADAGDIVLIATGWDRHFGTPDYYRHPYLAAEVARELVRRGIRTVGVDTLNPDPTPGEGEPFAGLPFHEVFLGAGGVIYENLTALLGLPGRVRFAGAPLHLVAGDGSPVRAYATIEEAAPGQPATADPSGSSASSS